MIKLKNISVLIILLLNSWSNVNYIYVPLSSSPLIIVASHDTQDQNNSHDCTWDGDDIVSNQALKVANLVFIKTDFKNSYFDKMPSKISNSIWQPPKQS